MDSSEAPAWRKVLPRDPLVTAVIVNYNSWPDTSALVESLARAPEVEQGLADVVVVDNASTGAIPISFESPPPGVRLIVREENGGFAVGVNTGWRASRSAWLLLLNPDLTVDQDLFSAVVDRIRGYGRQPPGIVGFGLLNENDSPQPSVGRFPNLLRSFREQLIPRNRRKYQTISRTRPGPVDWVTGACMLVNAGLLEALGGLDEDFFLYYEEVALCRSAQRLGWRVEFDPSINVMHLRPLQNRPVSPVMRVITRHSKLLYFRKHLPRWEFLSLCRLVSAEARVRGFWSWATRNHESQRAWQTILRIERALRVGETLGWREVSNLAAAISRDADIERATAILGARRITPPFPRKEGSECRNP